MDIRTADTGLFDLDLDVVGVSDFWDRTVFKRDVVDFVENKRWIGLLGLMLVEGIEYQDIN